MRRRGRWLAAAGATAALFGAAPPGAGATSVVLGPPDVSSFSTGAPVSCSATVICSEFAVNLAPASAATTLVAPADGTITSWNLVGTTLGGGASLELQVARPATGGGFLLAGTTPSAASVPVTGASGGSIPFNVGDRLAAAFSCLGTCVVGVASRVAAAASYGFASGALSAMTAQTPTTVTGSELGYNATVALDAPTVTSLSPTGGDATGGEPLLLSGQHLAVATSVTVGGVPATVVTADDGQIMVTTPPHAAGDASVQVTTAGGASAPATYTYTASATPTTTTPATGPTTTTATTPSPPPPDRTAPAISQLLISPSTFPAARSGAAFKAAATRGGRVVYRLSEPAKVVFTVQKRTSGVRKGRVCVRRSKHARGRACPRYVAVTGSFSRTDAAAGLQTLRFTGRIGGRTLHVGHYRLTLVATDAAGNRSAAHRVGFAIRH